MPGTEIDAIFAFKAVPSPVEMASSSKLKGKARVALDGSEGTGLSGKKRKKKKKEKEKVTEKEDNDPSEPLLQEDVSFVKRKRVEPETVVDPSASISIQATKRRKTASVLSAEGTTRMAKKKAPDHDDVDKFRDSRGTGPRACNIYPMYKLDIQPMDSTGRKTEEGFSIYKEDELGIGDRGGGQYHHFSHDVLRRLIFVPINTSQIPRCVLLNVTVVSPKTTGTRGILLITYIVHLGF